MASTRRHHSQPEELRRRVVGCRERLRRHRYAQHHRAGGPAVELLNAEPPPEAAAHTTATDVRAGRPAFVAAFRRDARF